MPGDGWCGRMGNPEQPGVSAFAGPSELGMPDYLLMMRGSTSTPLISPDGRIFFTEGNAPKSNNVFIVNVDGSINPVHVPSIAGTPTLCGDNFYVATEYGVCKCMDVKVGAQKWEVQFCAHCGMDSWSMAACKTLVILQGSDTPISDPSILPPCDHVYALDAATGATKWKFKPKTFVNNLSPCIVESSGVVVVTDIFGGLYCLKLADGSVKWQVPGEGSMIARCSGSVLVTNGLVYQALNLKGKKAPNAGCAGKGALKVYDLATGNKKWENLYESEQLEAHTAPVITPQGPGGKPALILGLGNYAGSPPPAPPSGDEWRGRLAALDPKTGKELWSFVPPVHRGVCVSGANETAPWKSSPFSTPSVGADGLIYVGWHGGTLFIIDGATGEKRSEYPVCGAVNGAPALGPDGTLAVTSLHYMFVWHKEPKPNWGKAQNWTIHKPLDRPFAESGTEHFAPCRVGRADWPYITDFEGPRDLSKPTWCSWYKERANGDVCNGGAFIDSQRNIWSGWNGGHIRCIRPDGTLRAEFQFPRSVMVYNVVLWQTSILFLDCLGYIYSYNMESLELNWVQRHLLEQGSSGLAPSVHKDLFLISGKAADAGTDGEDSMICVNCNDGSLVWRHTFSPLQFASRSYNVFPNIAALPSQGGREVVTLGTVSGGFRCIFLDDGTMYYESHLPNSFTTCSPTVGPGAVLYQGHNYDEGDCKGRLYAVDLDKKVEKWSYDCTRSWAPRQPVTQVPIIVPKDLTEDKSGDIVVIGLGSVTCGMEWDQPLLEKLKGELHGELVGLDASNAKVRWTLKVPPLRSVYPAGCSAGDTSPPDSWGGAVLSKSGVIYTYWQSGIVLAVNGTTGAELSRCHIGSFANAAPALAPGMLVIPAFDRIICWRDEALEDQWRNENSTDPRAGGEWKPLWGEGSEEEKGPAPARNPLYMDMALPFPMVGNQVAAAAGGAAAPAAAPAEGGGEGSIWIVVGGGEKGGIVVRKGEGLKTAELPRLSTGARIKELEKSGDRLHYEKVSGDGPDFGWVSCTFKGAPLVKRE